MTPKDKDLIEKLSKIILDKLKSMEKVEDARKVFRKKALKIWFPAIASQFVSEAVDRAGEVTELIDDRDNYCPGASETVFEKTFADAVTVWYWSKKAKECEEINPKVEKFVRSQVKIFVSMIGDEESEAA